MDNFKFLVKDSKPNVVSDNVFHIQWSLISFEHKRFVDFMKLRFPPCSPVRPPASGPLSPRYNVSEKAGTVAVTVKRTGNLNQYAIVLCRTEQASATSTSGVGTRPGQQDYVEYAGQVSDGPELRVAAPSPGRPASHPRVWREPAGAVRRAGGRQGLHRGH